MDILIAGAARLGINLTPGQIALFEQHYRLLVEWNQQVNLTSVTDYDKAQTVHFLDSLTMLLALKDHLADRGAGLTILDTGSGAGLPGVPVKLVLDRARLVLLDSVGKKTRFLSELVKKLGLEEVEVVTARAEDAARTPALREKCDVVLVRALAPLPVLAELTLPFARLGGLVIAAKKGDLALELKAAEKAVALTGGKMRAPIPVELPELADRRVLVVLDKAAPTPPAYPRRAGMPAKSPL
jgi:16S rRNA (guanine527-N7)-methyltransferase